jgi:membrane-bound serine protease (ClpP class)
MSVARSLRRLSYLVALIGGVASLAVAEAPLPRATVSVMTLEGAINPVAAERVDEAIAAAADAGHAALVVRLDTPGGLDTSMRQIVKAIQASPVPVIVYVAPSGSRAASAGAFITLSAHVAAMAPGAAIGAASPVNMGGEAMDKTMKKKVTNDAVAYIRSLAEARGRNADMAERFVKTADSITETVALRENVIDRIAVDLPTLLAAVDGMTVATAAGEVTLATAGAATVTIEIDWRHQILGALADPNVAYILMMLGFYGLFFELSNPGAIFPGVVGAIALILAFYALQALPINYAGAALILLAFILFGLEVFVPSFGALTIGGLVAFVLGSLMLVDSPEEYMSVSLAIILPTALSTAAFFAFLVGAAARAQFRHVSSGKETYIGKRGVADSDLGADRPGTVLFEGDLWRGVTDGEPVAAGETVVVTGINGLTLTVRPADHPPGSA